MKNLAALVKRADRWFSLLLALVVLVLYAPSVRFGLIWDDPRWYQQGAGQSPWQILTSLPSYQFYRPLAILLNRQLVWPNGVVNVPLAHAIQVGVHLVAVLACVPVLQTFRFDRWHARLTALLFAVSPFAFQAVAWQAPQQPLAVMWILLAILAANRFRACQKTEVQASARLSATRTLRPPGIFGWVLGHSGEMLWLGLSLVTYVFALLFQESAVPFVFVFFWLAMGDQPSSAGRRSWWPLLHLGLAAAYVLIWLNVPRQGNVTGQGFQLIVLGYLLQGLTFPVAYGLATWTAGWPLLALMVICLAVVLLLVLSVCKWGAAWSAAWSCAWVVAGLLPIWASLSWNYVETGPRLLYPASLGIAGLWATWGAWASSTQQSRWRRGLGGLVCAAVLAISLQQWWQFQKLYEVGTQHLARAVDVLSESSDKRMLFVNFPDRIELRPRPYPLGFWGVTLAPVVQNLSDYARAERGRSGEDRTLSAFLVGPDERRDWPYRVDMRGEDTSPEQLYQAAMETDAVYLTRYRGDGTLGLQWVGDTRPTPSDTHPTPSDTHPTPSSGSIATFGDVARLVEATADVSASRELTLRLKWVCLKPLREHDTIFVHFWRDGTFAGEADGDSLGGLIPLSAWRPDTEILDVRQVDVSRFKPGRYEVRVGIYNRVDSARYPARGPGGQRFPEDEAIARILVLP